MWSLPKSSVAALFLALACFSRDTAADWQGTLWNSSPEQTDQAFLVPHRNPTRLEFQYYFGKEARLCEKLMADLKLTYGTPVVDRTFRPFSDDPPDHSVAWYDQDNHNQVAVFYRRYPAALNFNDHCELRYTPVVVSASASSPEK